MIALHDNNKYSKQNLYSNLKSVCFSVPWDQYIWIIWNIGFLLHLYNTICPKRPKELVKFYWNSKFPWIKYWCLVYQTCGQIISLINLINNYWYLGRTSKKYVKENYVLELSNFGSLLSGIFHLIQLVGTPLRFLI